MKRGIKCYYFNWDGYNNSSQFSLISQKLVLMRRSRFYCRADLPSQRSFDLSLLFKQK